MSKLIWSLVGLAICLTFPGTASADITRGCKGNFQIWITQHKGTYKHGKDVGILDEFSAGGSCKNKFQANTCRERAKNYIFGCAREYWARRAVKSVPSKCRGARGGVGVKGVGRLTWFKPSPATNSIDDLNFAIEFQACCRLQPKADELTLTVLAVSAGDKGCGKNRNQGSVGSGEFMESYVMARGYRANCKRLRSMGWCS